MLGIKLITQYLPSNCYSSREIEIDGAVIHFISARYTNKKNPFDRDSIMDILKKYGFSYHILIERDGTEVNLVPMQNKAYHAGYSRMNGRDDCNSFTAGIALAGGSLWPYTDEQMLVLGRRTAQLMTEHNFSSDYVQGHDRVRMTWREKYPGKVKQLEAQGDGHKCDVKHDPGEHFRWDILQDMIAGTSMAIKNNI